MIAGEYAALDGAKVLAVPTRKGQKLVIKNSRGSDLIWESIDNDGKVWFDSHISLYDFSPVSTSDNNVSDYIQKVFKNAVRLNSEFLSKWNGFKAETYLEFPRNWGLGSSSTLIYLLAEWAEVNPLLLYFKVENGSGYDVAVAMAKKPIIYFSNDDEVSYTPVDFYPKFKDQLYFIHLNQKQDTKQGISAYISKVKDKKNLVSSVSEISEAMIACTDVVAFSNLMDQHEEIIHKHTGFKIIKSERFSDYWGSVKSLGAWGGDFALATSDRPPEDTVAYFNKKGFTTVIPYGDMI